MTRKERKRGKEEKGETRQLLQRLQEFNLTKKKGGGSVFAPEPFGRRKKKKKGRMRFQVHEILIHHGNKGREKGKKRAKGEEERGATSSQKKNRIILGKRGKLNFRF